MQSKRINCLFSTFRSTLTSGVCANSLLVLHQVAQAQEYETTVHVTRYPFSLTTEPGISI